MLNSCNTIAMLKHCSKQPDLSTHRSSRIDLHSTGICVQQPSCSPAPSACCSELHVKQRSVTYTEVSLKDGLFFVRIEREKKIQNTPYVKHSIFWCSTGVLPITLLKHRKTSCHCDSAGLRAWCSRGQHSFTQTAPGFPNNVGMSTMTRGYPA